MTGPFTHSHRLFITGIIASVLCAPTLLHAQKPRQLTAAQIVDEVQKQYENTLDYESRFVQTSVHKMFPGKLQRAYGTVMFRKGGLMRWEYRRPNRKLFIYDGATLWVYEPDVPQIFKGSDETDRLKKALAFLTGEGKIKDSYTVTMGKLRADFKEGHVLYLTPKDKTSPFQRVELYINKDTFRVERSIVVDPDDNRNRLDFHEPKVDSGLASGRFRFVPPAGVPIITP